MTDIQDGKLLGWLNGVAMEIVGSMDQARPPKPPWKAYTNWASALHHPCARHLTYKRLNWKDARPMDLSGRYRVEEGKLQEGVITRMLTDVGFEVSLTQVHYDWPEYEISGRTDGSLHRLYEPTGEQMEIPLEITTVNPYYWDGTKTIEDIKNHPKFWINRKASQLNLYLLMKPKPAGMLVLKTWGNRPRLLPMLLDYELGEQDIKMAELVNGHVAAGTYPDRIPYDNTVCEMCDFNHLCKPVRLTKAAEVDAATAAELVKYCDLQTAVDEQKQLAKKLIGEKKKPGIFYDKDMFIDDIEIKTKRYDRDQKKCPADCDLCTIEQIPIISTSIKRIGFE